MPTIPEKDRPGGERRTTPPSSTRNQPSMNGLWNLDLIRFFEFYLTLFFLLSIGLRLRQYFTIFGLIRAAPGRWPRVLQLLRSHYGIFLTRATLLSGGMALLLCLAHTVASR